MNDKQTPDPTEAPANSGNLLRTLTFGPGSVPPDSCPPDGSTGSGTLLEPATSNEGPVRPLKSPIASIFPGYEVLCELGRGAMGVVYKARNKKLPDKIVAIKALSRSGVGNIDELNRFRGEAALVSALAHENIVQIYDIETHNGLTYLILEYVDGGTLAERIRTNPPTPREAAAMVEKIARAINFAHSKKIIHRDLKPANVLLTKSGSPKVTDFGLGKLLDQEGERTHSGVIMGTPAYMAPEQAGGRVKEFGPPTDVYALGAILYEMLTRRAVFLGDNLTSLLQQVETQDPVPPSYLVPLRAREKELSTLCLKCLEKNPTRRFQTAGELADELQRWLDDKPIVTRPISRLGRLRRYVAKHPLPVALTTSVLIIVVLLAGGLVFMTKQREKDERRALEDRYRQHFVSQFRTSLETLNSVLDEVAGAAGGQQSSLKATQLHEILLRYYTQLADEENVNYLDPEDRQKLTDKLVRLAELIDRVDDSNAALDVLNITQRLIAKEKEADGVDAKLRSARVGSLRGLVLSRQESKRDEAEAECKNVLTVLDSLGPEARSDKARGIRAGVFFVLGTLYSEHRQRLDGLDVAADYYNKALAERMEVTPPTDPLARLKEARELGRYHGYLGDVYLKQGRFRDADRQYWESHRVRSGIVTGYQELLKKLDAKTEPTREDRLKRAAALFELDEARCQLARSYGNLGNLQYCRDHLHTAQDYYAEAHRMMLNLVETHPDDNFYAVDFCYLTNRYALLKSLCAGRTLSDAEHRDLVALTEKSIAIAKSVIQAQPDCNDGRSAFIRGNLLLSELLLDRNYTKGRDAFILVNDLFNNKPAASDQTPEMQFELARRDALLCEIRQRSKSGNWNPSDLQAVREKLEAALKNGALGKADVADVINEYRAFRVLRPAAGS